jgi:hypothetical protein
MIENRISNLIQLATGISIVIGLVLVIWELQQNREAVASQLTSDGFMQTAGSNQAVMGEQTANVLSKACYKPTELTAADYYVLDHYYSELIQRTFRLSTLSKRGSFYSNEYAENGNRESWGRLFESSIGRAFWKAKRRIVDPDVRAIGDAQLENWSGAECDEFHQSWKENIVN